MSAALPPFPKGWYAVGYSDEIASGSVQTCRLASREVVVFRTRSGELSAVDPICPHLGAHFGHGGTVDGETLRCPFHAFRFDTKGACVATGYGTKPPRVSARTWPIAENHGVVFVWWDPSGAPPSFHIPPLDLSEFTKVSRHTYRLRGHPQDTTENSVDTGHLGIVHGYQNVQTLEDLSLSGAYLHARYSFNRPVGLLGDAFGGVTAEFEVHVHGLGYSYVEVTLPALGLVYRNFVFATPVGPMDLQLRITSALLRLDRTPRLALPLRVLRRGPAGRALEDLIMRRSFAAYRNDVEQDFVIWNNKEYVPRPALAAGDGPVMRYRRWAEQFYAPDAATV